MRVLLLSDINSTHTQKWATALARKGIEIGIFSLSKCDIPWYLDIPNIKIYSEGQVNNNKIFSGGIIPKIVYFKALPSLKKIIKNIQPDIVHAHYATSYGFLGAKSGFHPFIISVWGSDVFKFPNISIIHRKFLKNNLEKADKILSTSHIMAKETSKYTDINIEVISFGVDLNMFKPTKGRSVFSENDIVIGTVKSLEKEYGIEYLIKAFSIIKKKYHEMPLKLLIVGGGSLEKHLKNLTCELDIEKDTIFTGKVSWNEVSEYQNMLTISVTASISESFGVTVIEASACEKPVIVSNIGGLPEVVKDGTTGFIVPPENPEKIAEKIEQLILNKDMIIKLGKNGRSWVEEQYNFENNLEQTINVYKDIM